MLTGREYDTAGRDGSSSGPAADFSGSAMGSAGGASGSAAAFAGPAAAEAPYGALSGDPYGRRRKKSAARRQDLLLFLAMLAVFAFTMCIRTGAPELIDPRFVLRNMSLWIRLSAADFFHQPLALRREELVAAHPYYLETVARFRMLLITMICGAIISLGGMVFQILFHNPMAAPSMLGVSSGVSLGLVILVVQYSADAYNMTKERLVYCLTGAFVMLALVLLSGRFAGKNRRSVTDMLLAGAVISQLMGALMTWLRFKMDQETLIVYQDLTLYGFTKNTTYEFAGRSLIALSVLAVICVLPLYRMRFSFNLMSFSDDEAKLFGLPVTPVRTICIIITTIIVTVTMLFCGSVGALSLIVPHICRFMYGSRFETMLGHTLAWGALLLLICRAISSLIYLEGMGNFPVGTLVGLISAPILAIVLGQRRPD